jgi:spore cortex formation protein SpoVR/YcgB (stage V sporulation)
MSRPPDERPPPKPRKRRTRPPAALPTAVAPLFTGSDWTFDLLRRVHDEMGKIAVGEMGLDVYPCQIEVITSEQMLDAYASIGMPLFYKHWSFGKRYAIESTRYKRGQMSLAYELVINSDPCICYLMEENSATMQALVIAHAAYGHNHFFKNNYLFKEWTRADSMLTYLDFARRYVAACEERHGQDAVEAVLDAAHTLMNQGVDRTPKVRRSVSAAERDRRMARRYAETEAQYDVLWSTLPGDRAPRTADPEAEREAGDLGLPEENILYFLEKHAPRLQPWQRELIRIVRHLAQYFHPQRQTKLMNEGCATFVHYEILATMHARGQITDGAMLEALHSHSSVVAQPGYDHPYYSGLNPYALGYAMMRDIKRICERPTDEDRAWFPDFAGCGDAMGVLRRVWADYRDESFVAQFLSPRVIREMRLFACLDDSAAREVEITAIHDEAGYRRIRRALARQYDSAAQDPAIEVVEARLSGNRHLVLEHRVRNGRRLAPETAQDALEKLAFLWGYRVKLREVDAETGATLGEHEALPEAA